MIGVVLAIGAACVLFAIVPMLAGWLAEKAYNLANRESGRRRRGE